MFVHITPGHTIEEYDKVILVLGIVCKFSKVDLPFFKRVTFQPRVRSCFLHKD